MWWAWILGGLAAWTLVAVLFGMLMGGTLRHTVRRALRKDVPADRGARPVEGASTTGSLPRLPFPRSASARRRSPQTADEQTAGGSASSAAG